MRPETDRGRNDVAARRRDVGRRRLAPCVAKRLSTPRPRTRDRYLALGHPSLARYADGKEPTSLEQAFSLVMHHSPFLAAHAPDLATYLERYPQAAAQRVESFAYWSLERLGGRPSLTATHVAIGRRRRISLKRSSRASRSSRRTT